MSDLKKFIPVTWFDARRVLFDTREKFFNGEYVRFSYFKPRVSGIYKGYRVEYGIDLANTTSGFFRRFFYRVKLNRVPCVPWYFRDRLPISNYKNVHLSFGWLKKSFLIEEVNTLVIEQLKNKIIPSISKELDMLTDAAVQINSGKHDLLADIAAFKIQAGRDSLVAVLVFTAGSIIVLGYFYVYIRFYW